MVEDGDGDILVFHVSAKRFMFYDVSSDFRRARAFTQVLRERFAAGFYAHIQPPVIAVATRELAALTRAQINLAEPAIRERLRARAADAAAEVQAAEAVYGPKAAWWQMAERVAGLPFDEAARLRAGGVSLAEDLLNERRHENYEGYSFQRFEPVAGV